MKKFFDTTSVQPLPGGGFGVLLDQRQLKTSAKNDMPLPSQPLAQAIADEWGAQGEEIDPATMPMTALAFTALDIVSAKRVAIVDEVAAYGATDLLCYQAEEPRELNVRIVAAWQPMLDWAAEALQAPLSVTQGLMAVDQPETSLLRLRQRVEDMDDWRLSAVQLLTSVLGSLILALADERGHLSGQEAFEISRVEERFQEEQWGADEEAEQKLDADKSEVLQAARFLTLIGAK